MSNNFINFPSLLDTSQVQNATFISNVFMMTLLTSLGFEGVRYYVGEYLIYILRHLENTVIFPSIQRRTVRSTRTLSNLDTGLCTCKGLRLSLHAGGD